MHGKPRSHNPGKNTKEQHVSTSELPQKQMAGNDCEHGPDPKQCASAQLSQKTHWLQHATFWSQVALGLIGIFALFIYGKQLLVMQGQLDQMKRSERPWISVRVGMASPLTFDKIGAHFKINFLLKNVGHSPAFKLSTNPAIVVIHQGIDIDREQRQVCEKSSAGTKRLSSGETLFPDEETSVTWESGIPRVDLDKFEYDRTLFPNLAGCVSYAFYDGQIKQTEFRYGLIEINHGHPGAIGIVPDAGDIPLLNLNLFKLSPEPGNYAY
jgi:hypothetical protein